MERLFSKLDIVPNNESLFDEALTHPSVRKKQNYERLEFLGDAVIELIATNYIFNKHPNYTEGKMTKLRALVVSRPSLASFAESAGLGEIVKFSAGELKNKGRYKQSNLSNAFEAVLGAIFIDQGYDKACEVFISYAQEMLDAGYLEKTGIDNPKGKLQELLQAFEPVAPIYKLLSHKGPDHQKCFVVEVSWLGHKLAQGQGTSKKFAESDAAMVALDTESWKQFTKK